MFIAIVVEVVGIPVLPFAIGVYLPVHLNACIMVGGLIRLLVEKLNENGIKIAIDDFGSGYSNLVELARLEPDYIKIDGEIVRNINSSSIHKIIAETIVYMTSKLKTELVAEYVENYELQQTIIDMHIRYSQGYLFSKPLPYEEIDSYLEKFI